MKTQETTEKYHFEDMNKYFKKLFKIRYSFDITNEVTINKKQIKSIIQYERYNDLEDEELILFNIHYLNKETIDKTVEKEFIKGKLTEYYVNNAIVISNDATQTQITYFKFIYTLNNKKQIIKSLKEYRYDDNQIKPILNKLNNKANINIDTIHSIFKDNGNSSESSEKTGKNKSVNENIQKTKPNNENVTLNTISKLFTYYKNMLKEEASLKLVKIDKNKYYLEKHRNIGEIEKNEDYIELSLYKPLPELNIRKYDLDIGNTENSIDIYLENEEELQSTIEILNNI